MEPGDDKFEYRETSDMQLVSGEKRQTNRVPEAGMVPVPLWLIGLSLLVVFGGGIYLGLFSGGFNENIFNEREGLSATDLVGPAGTTGSGSAAPTESLADLGKKVFTQNCVVCHQATGMGLPGTYPPLAKSEWVNGPSKRLAMILLKGLQGPVTVEGHAFNNAMPAWGPTLTDKKIAAVLTYVRSQFGNSAPPVAPEEIAVVRKEIAARPEPWTEAELLAVPAEAKPAATPSPAAPSATPAAEKK